MNINAQIIKKGSNNEFAVISFNDFIKMKEMIEDYEDLLELRKAKEYDKGANGKTPEELLSELAN